MAELFCFLMQWILLLGKKKIGASWRASTPWLISPALTAGKCWVGSTWGPMRRHRGTRKGSSYSRRLRLSRRTGSTSIAMLKPCVVFYFFLLRVHVIAQEISAAFVLWKRPSHRMCVVVCLWSFLPRFHSWESWIQMPLLSVYASKSVASPSVLSFILAFF